MNVTQVLLPEFVLIGVACVLFLLGAVDSPAARRASAWGALLACLAVVVMQLAGVAAPTDATHADEGNVLHVGHFGYYVKLLAAAIGAVLVLLAWPTDRDAHGGTAIEYGTEAPEFFALMLLSLSGVCLVAGANDLVLLFLGIELASIPTYVMVSISRPIPVAQEAGVKYFFLGAMAAALLLMGFCYLYGTTGLIKLDAIGAALHGAVIPDAGSPTIGGQTVAAALNAVPPVLTSWQLLAVVLLMAGFAFKIAAVPLHAYAGDVYTGAATPVTAFLAFVPKTSGFVAIVKLLYALGGPQFAAPDVVVKLLWVIAALTMTFGNVLGLLALNVKRVLAYSSVAHSGYMLVGLTALVSARGNPDVQTAALTGVLFYLGIYGLMNAGAFGVLQLLPARDERPATSAETYEDLAGTGRKNVGLGLAMAVCCFSLIGLPLTAGFFGKIYLIQPALEGKLYWLVVILMINAAISAAYYLKIVATMFLRPEPTPHFGQPERAAPATPFVRPLPVLVAVAVSVVGVLLLGIVLPATNALTDRVRAASRLEGGPLATPPAPAAASAVDLPTGR
ncbi:MAG TPA: NADH-quinone oxidoreductase subunit N [Tepidisphaeraceae bacterium]|nr:NADH-quinone oxidoreductase subunit N [Tepidisphaeraceae bacterium]